ncbi:hypothetical protein IW262DRAFT_396588 [Armillaria fumosa]|nr:hypothetical protein IW262DRAFT_396588 [Armillaria fumosa]
MRSMRSTRRFCRLFVVYHQRCLPRYSLFTEPSATATHTMMYLMYMLVRGLFLVCGTWRQVSHSLCSEIWATMSVTIWVFFLADVEKIFSHYCELRSRIVGGAYCHFRLVTAWPFYLRDGTRLRTISSAHPFSKYYFQSQRWKSAILPISPKLYQLLPVLHGRFPQLEVFTICVSMPVDADISGTFDVLAIAPRLKHLAFRDLGSDLTPVIEGSHLVTFCDDRQTMDRTGTLHHMYLGIIRDAPSLEEFSVGYQRHYEVTLPDASPHRASGPTRFDCWRGCNPTQL